MKLLISVLSTLFFLQYFAQNQPKIPIQYDSLVQVNENQVIVYAKSQSGIYNPKSQSFSLPMSTGHLHHFFLLDYLIKIDDKSITQLPDGEAKAFEIGRLYDFPVNYIFGVEYSIQRVDKNWAIIKDYIEPLQSEIPLRDEFGDDSLTVNGDLIYPEPYPGSEKSGLYDWTAQKWLIQPVYKEISVVGNYFIAISFLDEMGYGSQFRNHGIIDVYEKSGNQIRRVENHQITESTLSKDWSDLLKKALQADDAEQISEELSLYKLTRGNIQSLHKFSIQNEVYFQNLFENQQFEFIEFHTEYNVLLTYNQGQIKQFWYNPLDLEFHESNTAKNQIHMCENDLGVISYVDEPGTTIDRVFGVQKVNNHIIVHHYFPMTAFLYPLFTQYGEDSIDVNGNTVFSHPTLEINKSGVYDLTSKKWIIPNEYRSILSIDGLYLAQKQIDGVVVQNLFDKNGNIVLHNSTIRQLNNHEFVLRCFEGSDIYFANMQSQPLELLLHPETNFLTLSKFYVVLQDGKQKVIHVQMASDMWLYSVEFLDDHKGDFVDSYFNVDRYAPIILKPIVLYDNDVLSISLSLDLDNNSTNHKDRYEVRTSDFSLDLYELDLSKNGEIENPDYYLFKLTSRNQKNKKLETKYFAFQGSSAAYKIQEISEDIYKKKLTEKAYDLSEYNKTGDQIVVQKTPISIENDFTVFREDDNGMSQLNFSYLNGNSAVYRKTNQGWKMVFGPYAALNKTNYGYIAHLNFVHQHAEFMNFFAGDDAVDFTSLNKELKNTESGHQLLNLKFEAFTWKGQSKFIYINELDFGYHIFLNKSESILISKSGQVISAEHFEEFTLDN